MVTYTIPNPGRDKISDELHAAARLMYETLPGVTQEEVAKALKLNPLTIRDWCQDEGWEKIISAKASGPLIKHSLAMVRKEIDATRGVTHENLRALAMRESRKLRDAQAQKLNTQQEALMSHMLSAMVNGDRKKMENVSVAIDGITRLHKLQMQLWRLTAGEVPCMAKTVQPDAVDSESEPRTVQRLVNPIK